MKQSLSLNLKQKLLMTPKLQQSINILQLSTYELNKLIENEYMENPVLEMDSSSDADNSGNQEFNFDRAVEFLDYLSKDDEKPEPITADDDYKMKEIPQRYQTLEEFLTEQLAFSIKEKKQLELARYIIGLLDENGYLHTDLPEIAKLCSVSVEEADSVLQKIKSLEPCGVGAASLEECLAIQANKLNAYRGIVKEIIDKHLSKVAAGRIKEIAGMEHCAPSKVQSAIDFIRSLNPKPGASFGRENPEYIIPDVVVKNINDRLEVFINENGMPRLHVNKLYNKQHLLDEHSRKYIEERVNSAIWLLKSIEQRRMTLLKVVQEIVKQQEIVFYKGLSHMKPLLMKTVADNIGVHESTVSRTVANKYMEMPYGIVALKKFFAVNVSKDSGSNKLMIAEQVKNIISEIIEQENKQKPLSDQQIADILQEKNMKVSRRTVMKYREQLGYSSSAKRKRY